MGENRQVKKIRGNYTYPQFDDNEQYGARTVQRKGGMVSQPEKEQVIVATGVGRRAVQTTLATVLLSIEARNARADVAQAEVSKASGELLSYLGASGVTKMQTQGFTLAPRSKDAGYECCEAVWVEVPAERCGALLDGAMSAGAGAARCSGVSFKASDKVAADARLAAVEDAVLCAKSEALAAARALDVTVGKALHVEVHGTSSKDPEAAAAATGKASGKNMAPLEQTVTATVTVRFSVI